MGRERRPLKAEELEELRDRLLRRRDELWDEIRRDLFKRLGAEYQEIIQTVKDEEDLAKADLDSDTVLEVLSARKKELESIAQALWRMDKGEYGKCLECGRWIRFKRLQVAPWASYCRDCKARLEQVGRL